MEAPPTPSAKNTWAMESVREGLVGWRNEAGGVVVVGYKKTNDKITRSAHTLNHPLNIGMGPQL